MKAALSAIADPEVKTPCILVDEIESPLAAIARLVKHRREVDEAIAREVARSRPSASASRYGRRPWGDYGWPTWAEIGRALGTTGQAAQQRYGAKR